jgi:hypothetical protein
LAYQGKPHGNPELVAKTVYALQEYLGADYGEPSPERSFASPHGYGGRIDLHGATWVVDFKTKDKIDEKTAVYDEHGMQLSAYGSGIGIRPDLLRRINVFCGVDDGNVKIIEHPMEDHPRHLAMFMALFDYWKLVKKYSPTETK